MKYTKQDLTETKEERKQRKYRYLYQVAQTNTRDIKVQIVVSGSSDKYSWGYIIILLQVRMCHGDVISQVNRPIQGKYVQHLDATSFHW